MPRDNFAVVETSIDASGIIESIEAVTGTGASEGSTNCLAIEFDSVGGGAARAFCYFTAMFREGDASSDVYIDRYVNVAQPMLLARVPFHVNPNIDLDSLTGFVARLDVDGGGTINVERYVAGSAETLTSAALVYTSTGGVWQRWRMTVKDVGSDVRIKVQRMDSGSWTTIIDYLDEASPLCGEVGSFGFGVAQIDVSSTADPAIRFDDWKCERIYA